MKTFKDEEQLTLEDKRNRWIWQLMQKGHYFNDYERDGPEFCYEEDMHLIFKDDLIAVGKMYHKWFYIARNEDDLDDCCFETTLAWILHEGCGDLGDIFKDESLDGITIMDRVRKAGYPITFRIWQEWEGQTASEVMELL